MNQAMPTVFTPSFAGYAERIRASFARQGAMALVGAALLDVTPGYCSIALTPRPEVSQNTSTCMRVFWRRWIGEPWTACSMNLVAGIQSDD